MVLSMDFGGWIEFLLKPYSIYIRTCVPRYFIYRKQTRYNKIADYLRLLTGIGPALCLPNGIAILGATYLPGLRKKPAFSLFGATAPGGCVVGPVFAGLFANNWPWAFYSF